MTNLKNKIIDLGGKVWEKAGMERVYITSAILNTLEAEASLRLSAFSDKRNRFFLDVATGAIMRSYKNKKPSIEIQL